MGAVRVLAVALLDSAGGVCYYWSPFLPLRFGSLFRSPFLPLRDESVCWFWFLGVCLFLFLFLFFFWLSWLVSVGGGLCPPRCIGFGL